MLNYQLPNGILQFQRRKTNKLSTYKSVLKSRNTKKILNMKEPSVTNVIDVRTTKHTLQMTKQVEGETFINKFANLTSFLKVKTASYSHY